MAEEMLSQRTSDHELTKDFSLKFYQIAHKT